MILVYAEPSDIRALIDDEEQLAGFTDDKLRRLIRYSSVLVRHHTRGARYETTRDGHPTEPHVLQAMQDATIEHSAAVIQAGMYDEIINGVIESEPRVASTSENGASINLDYSKIDSDRQRISSGGLAPLAEGILRDAGLCSRLLGVVF